MIARPTVLMLTGLSLLLWLPRLADAEGRYREHVFDEATVDDGVPFREAKSETGQSVELLLDVYTARGDESRDRAAIVLLHGGGFLPHFDRHQAHIVALATSLARRGYVVVAPDYRVRDRPTEDPMGTLRDAVDDCRAAIDWLRANAAARGVDPRKIAVVGSSAGATVGVSLVGLENAAARRCGEPGVFAFVDLWGSPVPAYRLCNFDDWYPPTLIIHGTADAIVPFMNSEKLAADMGAAGVNVDLMAIPEAPHTPMDHGTEITDRVADFLADRQAM